MVEVREDGAETVVGGAGVHARELPHLAEGRSAVIVPALVEVEEIAHALVAGGEALERRVGDRGVEVGVAGDEEVGQPVTVHVAHRRPGVPAVVVDPRLARPLGEGPVPAVPQEGVVGGGRDVEIGAAVEVEVGGDAPVAAEREVGSRALAHVDERATLVVEERAPRQVALFLPARDVLDRVGVHDEQIEPSVVVVVEPAEASSHHRPVVSAVRGVPERALAETQPHLPGDVVEVGCDGAGRVRRQGRRRDGRCRQGGRGSFAQDDEAPVAERQLERPLEAQRLDAEQGGDRDRRSLSFARLERDARPIDLAGRDAQPREGDAHDLPRGAPVELGRHAFGGHDDHLRQPVSAQTPARRRRRGSVPPRARPRRPDPSPRPLPRTRAHRRRRAPRPRPAAGRARAPATFDRRIGGSRPPFDRRTPGPAPRARPPWSRTRSSAARSGARPADRSRRRTRGAASPPRARSSDR